MTGELPTASRGCHTFRGLKNIGGRSGKGREPGRLGPLCKPFLGCTGVTLCSHGVEKAKSLLWWDGVPKSAGRILSLSRFMFDNMLRGKRGCLLCIFVRSKSSGEWAHLGCCFSEGRFCLQKCATAKAGLDPGPVISILIFQANCALAVMSLKTILVLAYPDKSQTRGAQNLEKGHLQHSLAWHQRA